MAMTIRERLAQMRRMAVQLEVTDDPVEIVRLSRELRAAAEEYRDIVRSRAHTRNAPAAAHPAAPATEPASVPPGV
jgi:hypothetical protein